MSGDDITSDKISFKVRLAGEDYHEIVIDWKDTSRPYKQQVFRQLAEISGIPIELNYRFLWYTDGDHCRSFGNMETNLQVYNEPGFDKEQVMQLMDGNEHFGLTPYMGFQFYDPRDLHIVYGIIPERLIDETECTLNFCRHTDTRTYLNKLKTIITNDELRRRLKDLPVEPRFDEVDQMLDYRGFWSNTFRQFNIMQFYHRSCHRKEKFTRLTLHDLPYVPPQLYLRYRG